MTDAYFPPPVICLLTDSARELTSSSLSTAAISFTHRSASPVPSDGELIWRKRASSPSKVSAAIYDEPSIRMET